MPQLDFDGANSRLSADNIRGQSGSTITIVSGHNLVGSGSGLTALNASNLASGTLPMARLSGTLPALNGSALTALNATQLTSGTIPAARLGSKKILQAVAGSSGSQATLSSSTSWADTGHAASITPSATSSTIWVMVTTGGIYQATANQGFSYYTTLYRNGSNIGHSTSGLTATYCFGMPNYTNIFTRAMSMSKIDSPSSTSAVEYKIYHRTAQSGCTFYFNDSGTTTITLFEIGA
jgi:hypothetical protein